MKLKKGILLAAAVSVMLLLCFLPRDGCAPQYRNEPLKPPFFTLKNEKTGGVVYLLGTMHVAEPFSDARRVYPEEIFTAIEQSELVAVELDIIEFENDTSHVNRAVGILKSEDGAKELLGKDYLYIRAFFEENGVYKSELESYLPVMWSLRLSRKAAADCGYYSEYSTDRVVINCAKALGKPIYEFETPEEQYSVNASQDLELQKYTLVSAVNSPYDEQLAEVRELYSAWSAADGAALEKQLETSLPDELMPAYLDYYEKLYTARQQKFAKKISEWLENGDKVFVAVGALHLYAAPDIFDLLNESAP